MASGPEIIIGNFPGGAFQKADRPFRNAAGPADGDPLAGFLMQRFEPVITDEGIRVYGTQSYIAVFLLYTLFALAGHFLAFGIRETRQHLDVD